MYSFITNEIGRNEYSFISEGKLQVLSNLPFESNDLPSRLFIWNLKIFNSLDLKTKNLIRIIVFLNIVFNIIILELTVLKVKYPEIEMF